MAQQRCGTAVYPTFQRGVVYEDEAQFESWMKEKQSYQKSKGAILRQEATTYQVQVVVHVIHNGESLGQETNIPDAQILSQLEVLNKDFNRLNADVGNTPAEFQSRAGSLSIEFVLAKQDPEGLPSSGINRVRGSKSGWTINDNSQLKSLSYWPSLHYLNIWVCNLTDYLGFTQFPVSTLPGVENSSTNALTDGIIISYKTFGSSDAGNFNLHPSYNKGRTTTHEMGHFFGLRHLWGEKEDCTGTDYVDDTPPQQRAVEGCPSHPQKQCPDNNPVNTMFQNYMDFTDDNCQNLFTKGQVERMKIVLENSPRRASLLLPLQPAPETFTFEKLFSPNGDGINEYWKWGNYSNYEDCRLIIFNRAGNKVYEMTSYDGSWDGRTSSGQVLEEEAYYFILKCPGKKDITDGVRIIR
jgi:gliding motility-associated-like protein